MLLVLHASRFFPITTVSRYHARSQSFSHTSLSFVLSSAMKYISNTQITSHHNYMHTRHTYPSIQTLCIFTPQYITIYGNHYHSILMRNPFFISLYVIRKNKIDIECPMTSEKFYMSLIILQRISLPYSFFPACCFKNFFLCLFYNVMSLIPVVEMLSSLNSR